jgi:hypothetical protein
MQEQDLTLVGLTDDQSKLVLVSDAGERFTLAADAKLRAALRGDRAARARPGQLEITMESALRPRDIQARIRAGESPESVADAAAMSLDKVMGYATPVLAERAHVAQRAQGASARRKGEGPARTLDDAVTDQLRARAVDPGTVDWDAWRREDGRWTVVADFAAEGEPLRAEFLFDMPGRYVVSHNDEAKRLLGELPGPGSAPARPGASPRRLSSVPADEPPLGEDAIDLVSDDPAGPRPASAPDAPAASAPTGVAAEAVEAADGEESTVDLSASAAAVRGAGGAPQRGGVSEVPAADAATTGDADWIATQASDRPETAAPEQADQPLPGVGEPEAGDQPPGEPEQPRKPARKGRRASVPSWDEIMFGGGKPE